MAWPVRGAMPGVEVTPPDVGDVFPGSTPGGAVPGGVAAAGSGTAGSGSAPITGVGPLRPRFICEPM